MLARCERTVPASMLDSRPSLARSTCNAPSCSTTRTWVAFSGRLMVPLPPLMDTPSALMVAVTPCGRGTGCLATRDMEVSACSVGSGDDAKHFAAVAGGTRLLVRHHALRRGDNGDAQSAQDRRQLILTLVNSQPGPADALQALDHRAALEVLQLHRQGGLAVALGGAEILDIAFVLQHLGNGQLHFGSRCIDLGFTRALPIADAGKEVGDRIRHAHISRAPEVPAITSWPCRGPECHRAWSLRAVSRDRDQTCGSSRADAP